MKKEEESKSEMKEKLYNFCRNIHWVDWSIGIVSAYQAKARPLYTRFDNTLITGLP